MQSKGDIVLHLMKLGFNLKDIKKLTTLQVNMYLQRNQEPIYKEQIDKTLNKDK